MFGTVGQVKLHLGSCIAAERKHRSVHFCIRTNDRRIAHTERHVMMRFHQFPAVVDELTEHRIAGNIVVAQVQRRAKRFEIQIAPAGFCIGRSAHIHFAVVRHFKSERTFRIVARHFLFGHGNPEIPARTGRSNRIVIVAGAEREYGNQKQNREKKFLHRANITGLGR